MATTQRGPAHDPGIELRSIANSIEPAFPSAADHLRGIASLFRDSGDRALHVTADARPTCCTGEDSSPCCPGPALRERLAEAWDEGYDAYDDKHIGWLPNPYRD